jgi:hypothetical protein
MDVYEQIAEQIIRGQETIIGPVAVEQAQRVSGLKLDWPSHKIQITGDSTKVINSLVEIYKGLFGQTSVEVCKEAAASQIGKLDANKLPQALR